jgi:hypothetical protein
VNIREIKEIVLRNRHGLGPFATRVDVSPELFESLLAEVENFQSFRPSLMTTICGLPIHVRSELPGMSYVMHKSDDTHDVYIDQRLSLMPRRPRIQGGTSDETEV